MTGCPLATYAPFLAFWAHWIADDITRIVFSAAASLKVLRLSVKTDLKVASESELTLSEITLSELTLSEITLSEITLSEITLSESEITLPLCLLCLDGPVCQTDCPSLCSHVFPQAAALANTPASRWCRTLCRSSSGCPQSRLALARP